MGLLGGGLSESSSLRREINILFVRMVKSTGLHVQDEGVRRVQQTKVTNARKDFISDDET